MIVIFIIALIVIGPKQLPEIARMLGKGMAILRKTRDELTGELRETIDLERHVSQFRSDMEKYIEDEQVSMNETLGENNKNHEAQPGHIPVQGQKEAENSDNQEVKEKVSSLSDEKPLDPPVSEHADTEKADKAGVNAKSEHRESQGEERHG